MVIAPINTPADLLADVQLNARDFWIDIDGCPLPGPFAKLGETPIQYDRPAPKLGADQHLVTSAPRSPAAPTATKLAPREKLFEGLKVADFSWIAAGPLISKDLANLGATVLRVETENRIDTLRFLPPFKGDPGSARPHLREYEPKQVRRCARLHDRARPRSCLQDGRVGGRRRAELHSGNGGTTRARLRHAAREEPRPRDALHVHARPNRARAKAHGLRPARRVVRRLRLHHRMARPQAPRSVGSLHRLHLASLCSKPRSPPPSTTGT